MIEINYITWILAIYGAITFLPLIGAQFVMILRPKSQLAKDLLIGKGEDWRDKTHYKSALAFAWADLLLIFPLLVIGYIGIFSGQVYGHIICIVLGFVSIYFSILCWVMEKEYTYPSKGWITYYTYYWGSFLYWGIGVIIFSMINILSV